MKNIYSSSTTSTKSTKCETLNTTVTSDKEPSFITANTKVLLITNATTAIRDNKPVGNPLELKRENSTRNFIQNVNGLELSANSHTLLELYKGVKNLNVDIACIAETNSN